MNGLKRWTGIIIVLCFVFLGTGMMGAQADEDFSDALFDSRTFSVEGMETVEKYRTLMEVAESLSRILRAEHCSGARVEGSEDMFLFMRKQTDNKGKLNSSGEGIEKDVTLFLNAPMNQSIYWRRLDDTTLECEGISLTTSGELQFWDRNVQTVVYWEGGRYALSYQGEKQWREGKTELFCFQTENQSTGNRIDMNDTEMPVFDSATYSVQDLSVVNRFSTIMEIGENLSRILEKEGCRKTNPYVYMNDDMGEYFVFVAEKSGGTIRYSVDKEEGLFRRANCKEADYWQQMEDTVLRYEGLLDITTDGEIQFSDSNVQSIMYWKDGRYKLVYTGEEKAREGTIELFCFK